MKRCVQCQNELPDTAMHCAYCGARQPAAPAPAAGPGARTVMGYPGMASDVARNAGAPAGKPRDNRVSGFDATQPLSSERFRDGRDPRDPRGMMDVGAAGPGAGFDPGPAPRAASPGPQPFDRGPQPGGPGGPVQPQRYGSEPQRYGSEPQRYGSEPPPQRYGSEPQRYGSEPPPQRYGSEPQHGFGPPPGGPGFGPGPGGGPPPHQLGQHPFGPPSDPAFTQGPGPQGFGPPPDGFGYGQRPGSQPIPQPGFGPPPQQHGYGPPPDGGFGPPQHGYGPPPPAGSGFSPVHGPGPHMPPPQHGYGPPPGGGFHHRPETELVSPLRPPYNMPAPRRASVSGEPWSEPLKTLMLVFGVLLIACFVAPWSVLPGQTTFSWSLLAAELPVSIKIMPLLFIVTGVLSVVLGAVPLATMARGFAAVGIGLAPILYGSVAPAFDWRELIGLVGAVTLISGLLVRSHYTGEMIGRLLATIGAVCVLLQVLIPVGEAVPLVEMFKAVGNGQGAAFLSLVPVVLAILAFLVWLPPPGHAGAHILAWVMIVWPLVAALGFWLLGENIGDTLKVNLSSILYAPLAQMAWTALTGYGVATVVGKQLDHM